MRLTASEFDAERRYQGLMYLLRVMLSDSLLTTDEYDTLAREYADRLMPKTGSLLSRYTLLCTENRANMGSEEVSRGEDQTD